MTINTKEFREEGMKKLGIANLRPQQEAPMEAILNNEDVIVLMPTSGGKSLLYQLPAVMEPGCLTLVRWSRSAARASAPQFSTATCPQPSTAMCWRT